MKAIKLFFKKLFSWSTNNEFYYVHEEVRYEENRVTQQALMNYNQNKAS